MNDLDAHNRDVIIPKILAEFERLTGSWVMKAAIVVSLLGFFAFLLGLWFLTWNDYYGLADGLIADPYIGRSDIIHVAGENIISDIALLFFGIPFYFLAWSALALIWPGLAAYVFITSLKSEATQAERVQILYRHLDSDLKAARIREIANFDPLRYLRAKYVRQFYIIITLTILFGILFCGFFYLDRNSAIAVSEQSVEYSDYWSMTRHKTPLSGVRSIEILCRGVNKNKLILKYKLAVAGNRSLAIFSFGSPREFREKLAGQLAAWKNVDQRLRLAGVRVNYPIFDNFLISNRQEFVAEQCRAGLEALVGPQTGREVMQLLQLKK